MDRSRQLRADASRTSPAGPVGADHPRLRAGGHARSSWQPPSPSRCCSTTATRAPASSARPSTPRRSSERASASRSSGVRCSPPTGRSTAALSFFGINLGGWIGDARARPADDDPARSVAVRRYDGDLPRRSQAGSPGAVRSGTAMEPAPSASSMSVTLPMLSPVIFFNLLLGLINAFQVFASAYIIAQRHRRSRRHDELHHRLPVQARAFTDSQMGYASAMAWVLLIVVAVIAFILFRTPRAGCTTRETTDEHHRRHLRSARVLASRTACPRRRRRGPSRKTWQTVIWFDRAAGPHRDHAVPAGVAVLCDVQAEQPSSGRTRASSREPRRSTTTSRCSRVSAGSRCGSFFLELVHHRDRLRHRNRVLGIPRRIRVRPHRFKGLGAFFADMIGTLLLPFHVLIIPQYMLFRQPRPDRHVLPAAAVGSSSRPRRSSCS